jgi:hypothetical protein
MWMWAAPAGPLRPVKVICQVTTAPVSDFVTLAENVPRAPLTSPVVAGTSWAAFITVFS